MNFQQTKAWNQIQDYFQSIKDKNIIDFFDKNRLDYTTYDFNGIYFDFSKNYIDRKLIELFVSMAQEISLFQAIEDMFNGKKINQTEDRAVLHTALRSQSGNPVIVDGKNIIPIIHQTNKKIKRFTRKVISGKWTGYTGKKITDIVNIGIGGSELGPKMIVKALKPFRNHLKIHYLSNIDPNQLDEILEKIDLETTLFIIVSKSFSTMETLTNAKSLQKIYHKNFIAKHFVTVSTQVDKAIEFGIAPENIFPMWDWVGGRFSLWSPAGISIPLAIGFENYQKLLEGAYQMDEHFRKTKFKENIPFIASILSIIYNNLFEFETETYIPYTEKLKYLPDFLQQLLMESNGKSIDKQGDKVNYQTGQIVWGNIGTNAQHSFFQLLHQGTKKVPVHFIGELNNSQTSFLKQHLMLLANMIAQAEALMKGEKNKNPFKNFEGNRPSTTILFKEINPKVLGSLIAYFEHITFIQGIFWNINSFDQFGVELGKKLANKILDEISKNSISNSHDSSTKNLIEKLLK